MDKPIDFRVSGEETQIDRTVIERIRDPLVHLLRNAIDHGIEDSPADRKLAGKPEKGLIELAAYHEQGRIIIKIQDDGAGIDTEKLRRSAVKKGLLTPEAAGRLSKAEALNMIFMPGASTKEQATGVSGRGVGMDIVRSNIEAINGFVNVETEIGSGSTFTLSLPLTLATVQSLLVDWGETLCAVPLAYVLEVVRLAHARIETVQGRGVLRLRDTVMPLIPMGQALGMHNGDAEVHGKFVIVVGFGERTVGLAVDDVSDPQEIVAKSLGNHIGDTKGVSGASILGDGRVVLILDVGTLVSTAFDTRGVTATNGRASGSTEDSQETDEARDAESLKLSA